MKHIKEKMHLKTVNELMRRAVQWVEGESIWIGCNEHFITAGVGISTLSFISL